MSDEKYVCNLSPETLLRAKELGEDDSRREDDLKALREWIRKQPHLNLRTDAKSLLAFLRGCKFSLEKSKQKLEMLATFKTACPEFFRNWDPLLPEIRDVLELGIILPLPGADHKGRKVFIIRAGAFDPERYKFSVMQRASLMINTLWCRDNEDMFINGLVLVCDLAGYTMSHFTSVPLSDNKKMMMIWQDAYPLSPKSINYFNPPSIFSTVWNLISPLFKEKLRKRVKIHSDIESLQKEVPKSILPAEYGGDNSTVAEITAYWLKQCLENRDYLLDEWNYRSDESKRPGKPKTSVDLFGLEGSFRKLNVD